MRLFYASDYAYGVNPTVPPLIITTGFTGTGSQSAVVQNGTIPLKRIGSHSYSPLATNAPINVGAGTTADTNITPSAVSTGLYGSVTFTASYTYAHGGGSQISSYSVGLQEALNDASNNGGGAVVVDGRWAQLGGTTALITGAGNGSGASGVFIIDERGTFLNTYVWNGTAWTGSSVAPVGANGQGFVPFHNSELITISTSGSTSDSVGNLLPANSLILLVTGYVQTTIGTSTTWELGDPTTAARFSTTSSAVTAGSIIPTTSIPPVQIGTGVANATTGIWQLVAAKVRITTSGTSSAGKVRVDVYGFSATLPTS